MAWAMAHPVAYPIAHPVAYPIAHPVAYPIAHPKFCHFTNYKEKISTYVNKGQALEIRVIAANFLSNSSPRRPRFNV